MQDTRTKIIHIVGNARLGGVASFLYNYLRFADTARYRFDFVTYGESAFDGAVRGIDASSRLFAVPSLQRDPLGGMRALGKIFLSDNYRIVHSHLTTLSALALPPAAKAGIPVRICHAHSTFDRRSDHYLVKKLLRPFAARKATALAACGRLAAENLYRGRADEAVILPNAVDADRFACTPQEHERAKEALGLAGRTALFVGRFAYQKNLPFLLNAFAETDGEMTLALVGGGEEEGALRRQAEALGVGKRVRFVPPTDPAPWYKAADVFVLPSRYEGMPLTAVEAQAAGLACLLSDAVTREADAGGCAFLPARTREDAAAWARAMETAAPRREDARERIERAGYDIRKEAHRLTDLYGALLQRAGLLLP